MRHIIPTDTNRTYTIFVGLDMAGLGFVGAGLMGGFGLIHFAWPWALKVPAALVLAGIGAALGWGKWPLTDSGDRVGVWILRFVHYFLEEVTTKRFLPPPASASQKPSRERKSKR